MQTLINFNSGGKSIQAEKFSPDTGTPNGGLVVIVYGSDGMDNPCGKQIKDYADSLTQLGFIAIIPDYFASTSTKSGVEVFSQIHTNRDVWQKTVADAIDNVKIMPGVDKSRIGLLGFSLGGHLCLHLRDRAKVLVEYFAPELNGIGTKTSLKHAQIHHGEADELVPYTNAEKIKDMLVKEGLKEGSTLEFFPYSKANHGFYGSDLENSNARQESIKRTLSFFEKHL